MKPMKFGMGQAVRRSEDARFITGAGHYATDHQPQGQVRAFLVRAPHAHARFKIRNLDAVRAMKGVLLAWGAEDVADIGIVPCQALIKNTDDSKVVQTDYAVLARGEVRHIGDAVAFIVAKTLEQAKDAAEALDVAYEDLPITVGIEAALKKPGDFRIIGKRIRGVDNMDIVTGLSITLRVGPTSSKNLRSS